MTMTTIAAATAIVAAILIGGVYHTSEVAAGGVYVTNRLTGTIKFCYGDMCRDARDVTGQPKSKT